MKRRKWVFVVLGLFLTGVLAGVTFSFVDPRIGQNIFSNYSSSLDTSKEGLNLSYYIFHRNSTIAFFATFGGVFFGIPAVFTAFINGVVLGVVVSLPQIYTVLNPLQLFSLLFPHGIFEYTGTFIGLAFGLKLGVGWMGKNAAGKRWEIFLNDFRESLLIFPLVLVLLILAALIEANLTSEIACFSTGICGK